MAYFDNRQGTNRFWQGNHYRAKPNTPIPGKSLAQIQVRQEQHSPGTALTQSFKATEGKEIRTDAALILPNSSQTPDSIHVPLIEILSQHKSEGADIALVQAGPERPLTGW